VTPFLAAVAERMRTQGTALVLGVDPHPEDLDTPTAAAALAWATRLVEQAGPHAVAIKPNTAFFEAIPGGMAALATLIARTDLPVLLDVKRGDIGSTARAQAVSAYELLGADAVTAHPYLGRDAVDPFLRDGRAVFVLCHTSNPSAPDVQHLTTAEGPLYLAIARQALSWGADVGLVVGATAQEALQAVRAAHPDAWLLTPGVGAQGADAAETVALARRADGLGVLVPVSRGISRAADPAEAAARYALDLAIRHEGTNVSRDPLLAALADLEAIRFGTFTLRSGATSPVYVDCRRILGSPRLLGALAAKLTRQIGPGDIVAGVPTAGVPLGTAVSLLSGRPLVYPRSAAKAHGTGRRVEGFWSAGDRVVLVDDVATRGTSLLEAASTLREAGLVVERALVLVDRGDGAAERLADAGITLHALYTLADVLAAAP
jgi:uridine monophosphate synthetase